MKIYSLMYHDVVKGSDWSSSGFKGAGADVYKVSDQVFEAQIKKITEQRITPKTVFDIGERDNSQSITLITFDDGGNGAHAYAADILEQHGWRGHFFVATDFINTDTFLSEGQIRDLSARGHIIGSHSASHPTRMAACSPEILNKEWRSSVDRLSDIVGKEISVASVPGGYYSPDVGLAASANGISYLFNSEPVSEPHLLGECYVLGRYTIQRNSTLESVVGLACGRKLETIKQAALWGAKKVAKKLGGTAYVSMREKIINSQEARKR